jgi:hypothetical protein
MVVKGTQADSTDGSMNHVQTPGSENVGIGKIMVLFDSSLSVLIK